MGRAEPKSAIGHMDSKEKDYCPACGAAFHYVIRKWSTHWITGGKIRPKRVQALKFKVCECSSK